MTDLESNPAEDPRVLWRELSRLQGQISDITDGVTPGTTDDYNKIQEQIDPIVEKLKTMGEIPKKLSDEDDEMIKEAARRLDALNAERRQKN